MRILLPLLLALSLPLPAAALSRPGHEIVGELAERQLSPAARKEARMLLADEKVPTLAGIAAWADELRANDPDLGKRSAPWHYINFPADSCAYVAERDCRNGDCVVGAIDAQLKRLADRSLSRGERAEALKFVVHFVGDVHQPLHAGNRGDKGGNEFQVRFQGEGSNLHVAWDRHIVASAGHVDSARHADALQTLAPLPGDASWQSPQPSAEWAMESCRAVDAQGIYPNSRKIGQRYLDRHRPYLETQLRLAGARLAQLLEPALAPAGD